MQLNKGDGGAGKGTSTTNNGGGTHLPRKDPCRFLDPESLTCGSISGTDHADMGVTGSSMVPHIMREKQDENQRLFRG